MLDLRLRSDIGTILRALIPLNVNIATIVSVLLVSVAGAIVANDQIVGRRAALGEAKSTFQSLGETVRVEIEALRGPVETAVQGTAMAVSLLPAKKIFTLDTVRLFAQRLSETDKLYALYYGDHQGNFVLVFNLALAAPQAGAAYLAWIIQRPTSSDFRQTVIMLDAKYEMLSADHRQNNGYDPRARPWFHAAMRSDGTIQTPPYVYFETNDIGITIATRTADGNGVVGGDLTLKTLSRALEVRRASENALAVVFDESTAVLAAANTDHVLNVQRPGDRPLVTQQTLASTGVPAYRALSRLYASGNREGVHQVEADGEEWVVWISPVSLDHGRKAVMSILSPAGEVFAEVSTRMQVSLGIAAMGVSIGLIFAWIFANAVARPIRNLTDEAYQMRTFDLSEREPIKSRILEVQHLSQAVQTLKRSLGDFARYVPAQLVRRLVAGDMTADIGGERCTVTLLFTDIADFTAISESMEPMELMQEVSEYFASVSAALIENGATIDKYIGDAIMAMWNAPVRQENHVELACRAALDAASVIRRLNDRRIAEGRPPFKTRFGLHVGEAVVGNVGSAERMNYTALGETVNLAARLEGLNKQLGTQILVSEAMLQAAPADAVVRPVDMVRPKGASRPVRVYELISPDQYCSDAESTEAHLESWQRCYTAYTERRWTDAIAEFDRHVQEFPRDEAAQVLRARTRAFKEAPPPDGWDGVFDARTK